jgi:hypothetical protein
MNTGMQDACNLAWKLAMVCHGEAMAEPLLQSYSIERSAVGKRVLSDAGRLTALATLRGGVLQEIRNVAASIMLGLAPVRSAMASKLAEISIAYHEGPMIGPCPRGWSGPRPGERAPVTSEITPVGRGSRPRFELFGAATPAGFELAQRLHGVVDPTIRPPLENDGVCLVRPDGYVAAAAGAEGWPEIEAFIQKLIGKPGRAEEERH